MRFTGISISEIARMVSHVTQQYPYRLLTTFQTHSMCFLFGRATRSVGLVPAAYYADLAADRARYYVRSSYMPYDRGDFDETDFDLSLQANVANSMFYI